MKTPIRVAVIGAGMAGQAHAFGYRNATMAPDLAGLDVQLRTIVDPNAALAASVGDRYGFATTSGDIGKVPLSSASWMRCRTWSAGPDRGDRAAGSDGLLNAMTKTLIEAALEEEIADHPGHDKHAVEGRKPR